MVSVNVPCTGCDSRMMPAPIASTADKSDHQKPGMPRAQNVSANPAMPLIRNIQPRKIVTARLASGGTIMAAKPSMASRMPSIRNTFQCARAAALISDCSLAMSLSWSLSWGRVMTISRCRQCGTTSRLSILTATRCGREGPGHRAHAVAAKKIDPRCDKKECAAEQDRDHAERNEHPRDIAVGIEQPVMDRAQHEGETNETGAATDDQERPHPSELAQAFAGHVGAG